MTLAEAIAVFYPDGPLTVSTLRAETRKGRLTPAVVGNTHFITPAQPRALLVPKVKASAPTEVEAAVAAARASVRQLREEGAKPLRAQPSGLLRKERG